MTVRARVRRVAAALGVLATAATAACAGRHAAVAARLIDAPSTPTYPLAARVANMEGEVTLLLTVDANGRVLDSVRVLKGTHAIFERSVRHAVRGWQFASDPRRARGADTVRVAWTFRLRTDSGCPPPAPPPPGSAVCNASTSDVVALAFPPWVAFDRASLRGTTLVCEAATVHVSCVNAIPMPRSTAS